MTRIIRYISRVVLQTILMLFGMTALLLLFYAVTTEPADRERIGGVVLGVVSSVGLIFPMILEMNIVTNYLPLTLSMSITRRSCFLGILLTKVELAVGVAAVLVGAEFAAQYIFNAPLVFVGARLVSMLALLLISASFGETFGMLGLHFGRTLMMILSIGMGLVCGLCGGLIGFLGAEEQIGELLPMVLSLLENPSLLWAIAVAVLLVLSAVDWRICRRISVK